MEGILLATFGSKLHKTIFYFVVFIFYIIAKSKYKIFADGLETPPENIGIIVTNNHQRNDDVFLITPVFLSSWKKWKNIGSFSFTCRDDLFQPGFFAKFYPKLFVPIRMFFFYLNTGSILNYLNTHPLNKLGVRNLHELLLCIGGAVGDKPLNEVLASGWENKYHHLYKLHLKYENKEKKLLLSECYRYSLLRDLRQKASYEDAAKILNPTLKSYSISIIKKSLDNFSDLLQNGRALYFPAEGALTQDGAFMSFRAGLGRIVEKCGNTSLIPINITYDYMDKGRSAVFVRFGKTIHIEPDIDRDNLKQLVNGLILKLQTVAMTSLFSLSIMKLVMIEGRRETNFDELLDKTRQILDICRRHKYYIDTRLDSTKFYVCRLRKVIFWGEKIGLWDCLTYRGSLSIKINLAAFHAEKSGPWPNVNYIRYAVNQIPQDILSEYLGSEYLCNC